MRTSLLNPECQPARKKPQAVRCVASSTMARFLAMVTCSSDTFRLYS